MKIPWWGRTARCKRALIAHNKPTPKEKTPANAPAQAKSEAIREGTLVLPHVSPVSHQTSQPVNTRAHTQTRRPRTRPTDDKVRPGGPSPLDRALRVACNEQVEFSHPAQARETHPKTTHTNTHN